MAVCTFSLLPDTYAVARLDARTALPAWALAGDGFMSITRAADELSIVCDEKAVPADVRVERGWHGIRLHGPFAFDEVGILASIAGPLATARIGIFAISTFDTDYVFVKAADMPAAIAALVTAGHVDASTRVTGTANDPRSGDAPAHPSPSTG